MELGTVGLPSASRTGERPSATFDYFNRGQGGGFPRGAGGSMQGEPSGQNPDTDHLLGIHSQRLAVERILAERPQLLSKRPSVDLEKRYTGVPRPKERL